MYRLATEPHDSTGCDDDGDSDGDVDYDNHDDGYDDDDGGW